MRNPLASVFGLVDLLHERLPEQDEGHRHLEVLARAAGRIERLVSQLLDLVPTEIHDLETADLTPVVREAVSLVRVGAGRGQVSVREHYDEPLPACRFDPDRIGRAVENLLHNAFAHTPDAGRIDIRTRAVDEAAIEIEVMNTGSYIPPEERERIFQPFVSARASGTGLGLAIAQQIVVSHGGTLEVLSEPDRYTAFVIRLPITDADDAERDDDRELESMPQPLAGAA